MQIPPVVYDAEAKAHRPMAATERVEVTNIPVSDEKPGNRIEVHDTGLYVGDTLHKPVVFVASTGTDDPSSGSVDKPYKTLDYALTRMITDAGARHSWDGVIALRCGDTFELSKRMQVRGTLLLTFYGDPRFGSFNSALVNGLADPAMMETLTRPEVNLNPMFDDGANLWRSSGLDLADGYVELRGVNVNLAPNPTPEPAVREYGLCDMFHGTGKVRLYGSIINRKIARYVSGFIGVQAEHEIVLNVFGSQFLIEGKKVASAEQTPLLIGRQYFVKFYNDPAGNNALAVHMVPDALTSSNGSGFLKLSWSDTSRQLVSGTDYNLDTFPLLSDYQWGFRNYLTGIVRDQQGRSLNVITSRWF